LATIIKSGGVTILGKIQKNQFNNQGKFVRFATCLLLWEILSMEKMLLGAEDSTNLVLQTKSKYGGVWLAS
jgi:hypothetical protein